MVFFKDGVPNIFDGDLNAEEEVLYCLIEMKVENHIEHITRPMLEVMVNEIQYLAVFFCKFFHVWVSHGRAENTFRMVIE